MANRHGGYRRPRNPAPASGPGKLARRTDGGPAQKQMAPTGMPYGDQKGLLAQESMAPMAQADNLPSPPSMTAPVGQPSTAGPAAGQFPDFGRPTERPDEPITSGVDIGPGPGSEALPLQHQPQFNMQGPITQMLQRFNAADMTGSMAGLYEFARNLGA